MFTCSKCDKSYHPHCHVPKFSLKLPSRVDWRCKQCTVVPVEALMADSSPKRIQPPPIKAPLKAVQHRSREPTKSNLNKDIYKDVTVVKRVSIRSNHEAEANYNGFSKPELSLDNIINDSDDCDSGFLCDIKEEGLAVVPDVSKWSFNDVYDYFYKLFGNDALIFKDQEIDGTCIMVMKRSDVIPGFQNGTNLKLGTLLKMYNHILSFQTKIRSPSLSWK